jgi:hypothetical protein
MQLPMKLPESVHAQWEDVYQHINQKSIGTVQCMHEISRQFLLSNTWNRPTCREAIVASNTQIPDTFPSVSCLRILRFGSSGRKFPISPVQGALLTCARLCLRKISSILVLQFLPICVALAPVQPALLPILHLGGMLLPPKVFQHYIALTNRILHHWQSEVKSYFSTWNACIKMVATVAVMPPCYSLSWLLHERHL